MQKLWITRPLPQRVVDEAARHFDVEVRQETTPLSHKELIRALAEFDAVLPTLGDVFEADLFASQPQCRILANFGVGFNHIDAQAARAAGVEVSNTPGAVTDATADIAMTLILMTCRRAGEGERMVRAGAWPGWHPTQLLGMHVTGKTIGLVGMGRIGKAIAQRAKLGFGMDVVFYNRSDVSDLPFDATQLDTLPAVLRTADVVVLAVPATPQTHHIMDAAAFAAMKPGGYLVNIARGDVVEERALIAALLGRFLLGWRVRGCSSFYRLRCLGIGVHRRPCFCAGLWLAARPTAGCRFFLGRFGCIRWRLLSLGGWVGRCCGGRVSRIVAVSLGRVVLVIPVLLIAVLLSRA